MATSNNSEYNTDLLKIKPEPEYDGVLPGIPSQDLYEDAGDLDLSGARQSTYLTRLPKFLWRVWTDMNDDRVIQLGTIRVEGNLEKPTRLSLMLASDVVVNQKIPKEYNLPITHKESTNTFLFSEKDLPGYAGRNKANIKQDEGSLPISQVPPRPDFLGRVREGTKVDKTKRARSYYRRAIPKKTALTGRVGTEINCLPVENEEYQKIMDERARLEHRPKRETQMIAGIGSGAMIGKPGSFDTFIKTTGTQREKKQTFKAARIPKNELLDLLFACFKEYKYWGLKTLRNKVNQPEAYLKETLESIADLVRQGTYANTWRLKPAAAFTANIDAHVFEQAHESQAPAAAPSFDGASDVGEAMEDEDENEHMEDAT